MRISLQMLLSEATGHVLLEQPLLHNLGSWCCTIVWTERVLLCIHLAEQRGIVEKECG